jgi:hypothetical protein
VFERVNPGFGRFMPEDTHMYLKIPQALSSNASPPAALKVSGGDSDLDKTIRGQIAVSNRILAVGQSPLCETD